MGYNMSRENDVNITCFLKKFKIKKIKKIKVFKKIED